MKSTLIGLTNFTSLNKNNLLLLLQVGPNITYFITSFKRETR